MENKQIKEAERSVIKAKAKLQLRRLQLRREQLAFDKLTPEEQEQRRRVGLDPYEPEFIRARKKAAALEERKRLFKKLPKETRDALTALGVSPYREDGEVIRRFGGGFSIK